MNYETQFRFFLCSNLLFCVITLAFHYCLFLSLVFLFLMTYSNSPTTVNLVMLKMYLDSFSRFDFKCSQILSNKMAKHFSFKKTLKNEFQKVFFHLFIHSASFLILHSYFFSDLLENKLSTEKKPNPICKNLNPFVKQCMWHRYLAIGSLCNHAIVFSRF